MKVLSDSEIKRLIKEGQLEIDPMPEEKAFQPASIDLKLGKVYMQKSGSEPIDTMAIEDEDDLLEEIVFDSETAVNEGKFRVLETEESIRIPEGHVARVFQRSRYGRILAEAFGFGLKGDDNPLITSGKKEKVRYALKPFVDTKLYRGERVSQLVIFDMKDESPDTSHQKKLLETSENTMECSSCGNILLHAQDVYMPKAGIFLDPSKPADMENDFEKFDGRFLQRGRVYLATSRETFKFSDKMAGIVEASPCACFCGMQNYLHACFAGFVDPGYQGGIMMQIYSNWGRIDREGPLTIMTVYPVKGDVERPYGSPKLVSSHQGIFKSETKPV